MQNEKLYSLYSSLYINRVVTSRRVEWARNTYRILVARNDFVHLGVERKITNKLTLMTYYVNGYELDSSGLG
jgi:hypothetical protein